MNTSFTDIFATLTESAGKLDVPKIGIMAIVLIVILTHQSSGTNGK